MFTCVALIAATGAWAQNSFTSHREEPFSQVMEAVLHDFPYNYRNISGDLVLDQAEIENYASLVQLPGASECIVTRYHSEEDSTASWQAKMFHSEDFKAVSAQYRDLYRQLKNCYLRLVDGSLIYLDAEWEAPTEEKSFVMSSFRLITGDERYKEMKIDLEMVYQFPEWTININVAGKKDDSLKGYANENGK
jgi:hypothetical protein